MSVLNKLVVSAGFAGILSGCISLSGYDSSSHFACAAPPGVSCTSMSGVNANIDAGKFSVEAQSEVSHAKENSSNSTQPANYFGNSAGIDHVAITAGMPVRSPASKLRVWWAPWEDSDGDVNDQSYSYMVTDPGHWEIERVRAQITAQYSPQKGKSDGSTLLFKVEKNANSGKEEKPISPPKSLGRSDANQASPSMPNFMAPGKNNESDK